MLSRPNRHIAPPGTEPELKATAVAGRTIEQVSAKTRSKGVGDGETDHALPIHPAQIPVSMAIGKVEPCPRRLMAWRGRQACVELRNTQL